MIIDTTYNFDTGTPNIPDDIKKRVRAGEKISIRIINVGSGFVKNALMHGVAGLNIDASRIGTHRTVTTVKDLLQAHGNKFGKSGITYPKVGESLNPPGRWPANILLSHHPSCEQIGVKKIKVPKHREGYEIDKENFGGGRTTTPLGKSDHSDSDGTEEVESWNCHEYCPVAIMDAQSGERKAGASVSPDVPSRTGKNVYGKYGRHSWQSHGDTGFASRFFYTAKASKSERQNSTHPTIKPLALIEYLVKLTSPPADAHILDCFIGSGTLALACENLDVKYTGIDLDCGDAIDRIKNMPSRQLGLF